jgi:class 3 adenylate cyclase/tetratricopeptide (TPR) repeat protein
VEDAPVRAIERKVITALFCDVVGSTELGERLDPEDIDRLLSTYHRLARRRIEANSGVVEKFIGDAVVGVFGAPSVHEDDPARAIRSALSIVRDLEASRLDLQVRIGIQTGEAVVRVGDERTAEEGLATGDILNTAARLQGVAVPGGIAVGDPTYRLTAREFEWEDLGPVTLKGKAQPVQTWRPLRESHEVAPPASEATPFLGREPELASLIRTFERAAGGPGIELVTILAEPGLGKSRLVRELGRRVLATGTATWHKGRCLPYGEGISFWALGEIVKSHAGILETDDQPTLSAKLDAAISEPDPPTHAWIRERLAPLVGLRTEAAPPPQEEAFSAWTRFASSLAADGPAVLVFEDLHWADPALVSFLIQLADAPEPVPLLLVVTARPEVADRHPEWLARAGRSTVIQLVSLDDAAIRSLVEETIAGASETLIATILERAAGSPLYAEQLVALVRERGFSTADATLDESAIPPTIQALLAARIDALPRDLKPALLDASVIGRIFWSGAVASLEDGEAAPIAATLDALARRELTRELVPSTMAGEAEYSFWHALLRDVAYSFLPRGARLAKHRAAAAWITERAGGALGDLAEIVADHLMRALELAAATGADEELPATRSELATALIAAGEHTRQVQPVRAIGQLRTALELIAIDDARRPRVLEQLAEALIARSEYIEGAATLEAAAQAFRDSGDELAAAGLALRQAPAYRNIGDQPLAMAVVEAARPILNANPGRGLVDLHIEESIQAAYRDDHPGAVTAANAALALAASLGLPKPYRALGQRGLARQNTGDPAGEADLREAVDLAIAAGDSRYALSTLSNRAEGMARVEDALAAYDEGIAFAERYGLSDAAIRGQRFEWLELAGRWDEILEIAPAMLAEAAAHGNAYSTVMIRMARMAVEAARGPTTSPTEGLTEAAIAIGFRPYVPGGNIAQAAFVNGDPEGARRIIGETLGYVGEGEWTTNAVAQVQVALAMEDVPLAHRVLAKAYPEAGTSRGRGVLSQLATALVLEAEGNIAEARPRFQAAVDYFTRLGWVENSGDSLAGLGRCQIADSEIDAGLANLQRAREIAVYLKTQQKIDAIDAAIAAAKPRSRCARGSVGRRARRSGRAGSSRRSDPRPE